MHGTFQKHGTGGQQGQQDQLDLGLDQHSALPHLTQADTASDHGAKGKERHGQQETKEPQQKDPMVRMPNQCSQHPRRPSVTPAQNTATCDNFLTSVFGSAHASGSSSGSPSRHVVSTPEQTAIIKTKLSELCFSRSWCQLEECVRYQPCIASLPFQDARTGRRTTVLHEVLGWLDCGSGSDPNPAPVTELERREIDQRKSLIRTILVQNPRAATVKNEYNCVPLVYALRSCSRSRGKERAPHVSRGIVRDVLRAYPEALRTSVSTSGKTLLHVAVMDFGNANIIKMLIDEDESIVSSMSSSSSYESYSSGTRRGGLKASLRLVTWKDNTGWIPLHYACDQRYCPHTMDVLKILLQAYPDGLHARTKGGDTPLSIAQSSLRRCEKVEDKNRMARAVKLLVSAMQRVTPPHPTPEPTDGTTTQRRSVEGSVEGAASDVNSIPVSVQEPQHKEQDNQQRYSKQQDQPISESSRKRKVRAYDESMLGRQYPSQRHKSSGGDTPSSKGAHKSEWKSDDGHQTQCRVNLTGDGAREQALSGSCDNCSASVYPISPAPAMLKTLHPSPIAEQLPMEPLYSRIVAHLKDHHRTEVEGTRRRIDMHMQNGREHEEKRERLARSLARMSKQIRDKSTELRRKGFDIPKMFGMDSGGNGYEDDGGGGDEDAVPSSTLSLGTGGDEDRHAPNGSDAVAVVGNETVEKAVSSSLSPHPISEASILEDNLKLMDNFHVMEREHNQKLNRMEQEHDRALDAKSSQFQKDVRSVKHEQKADCEKMKLDFRKSLTSIMLDAADKIKKDDERVKEEETRWMQLEVELNLLRDYVNNCVQGKNNRLHSKLKRVQLEHDKLQCEARLQYEQQITDAHEELRRSENKAGDLFLLLTESNREYVLGDGHQPHTPISVETIGRLRGEIESLEELIAILGETPRFAVAGEDDDEDSSKVDVVCMNNEVQSTDGSISIYERSL